MSSPDSSTPAGDVIAVALGEWSVTAAMHFGPRIMAVSKKGSLNPLAQHGPEVRIDRNDNPPFVFHGGHRLWASPEDPPVTYAPDDHPCLVDSSNDRISINAPVDSAGLVKQLSAHVSGDRLVVEHTLLNTGPSKMEIGVWTITQLRMGGTALLPVRGEPSSAVQADRNLSVWPYTKLSDPRISWVDHGIEIEAESGPRLKLGSGPRPERLGYLLDDTLFVKSVTPDDGHSRYPDRGAVGQVFVDENFCELEALGPITGLEPGESVSASEVWDIVECADHRVAWEVLGR